MTDKIIEILDRPEDGDLWGWDGPGFYFSWEGLDLTGPFKTYEEAAEALASEQAAYNDYLDSLNGPENDWYDPDSEPSSDLDWKGDLDDPDDE